MKEELQEVHERLRAALRLGDPAAGDALAPEEVRALRRAALAEAEQAARRRWVPLPASALAGAVAVCCLVAALALWRVVSPAPEGNGGKDRVTGQAAAAAREGAATAPREPASAMRSGDPAPAGAQAAALPERRLEPSAAGELAGHAEAPGPAEDVVRTEIAAAPEEVTRAAPSVPGAAAEPGAGPLVARAPDAAAEPPGLKLQFSTPGGTRIIWVLTSDSES